MRFDRELLSVEAERKLFHISWVLLPLLYYFGFPRAGMLLLLFLEILILAGFEVARKKGYSAFSASTMRPHEKGGMLMGTFFQVSALFLAVLLFDKPIAVLAMLFNCIGDSVTAFAGALLYCYLGRDRTKIREFSPGMKPGTVIEDLVFAVKHHKSPVLMGVMFVTCMAIGVLVYPDISVLVIGAGALGGMVADGFAWKVFGYTLNDDLTISLLAGLAMMPAMLL
jgi:dolichol kinase